MKESERFAAFGFSPTQSLSPTSGAAAATAAEDAEDDEGAADGFG